MTVSFIVAYLQKFKVNADLRCVKITDVASVTAMVMKKHIGIATP